MVIAETQGTVTAVYAKVGTQVKPGTVLIQVDDEIPRWTKAAAEINFQKAQRDYKRAEDLYQENSISVSQLDASRLAMKAAENQLDIARRQLDNTRIKSPIAGTVNARYVDLGTMVQPGMAVANVVDIGVLKVRVNVAEREAFQLKVGDRVDISTDVYPGTVFEGVLDNIASKADAKFGQTQVLEVGDVPGHQMRITELLSKYPGDAPVYAGVKVVEARGVLFSDYVEGSGNAFTYTVSTLENGDKIFSRTTILTQTSVGADGGRRSAFSAVTTLTGGTDKFTNIRGTLRGSGFTDLKSGLSGTETEGEYWFAK